MSEQQNRQLLDLPKVIAVGIASPAGAALTSRFGVAGTLLGLALSAVIITVVTDFLKVYLARVPGAVTSIPGGFRKEPARRRFVYRIWLPFSKFLSLPPKRRRSILIGSVVGGGIAFFVGLGIVTAFEVSVGKNLSCWIWNDCPTAASSTEGEASNTSTLPSIFGGGQNPGNSTPVVTPTPSPQPAPAFPGAPPVSPSQPQASPGSEAPSAFPQPDRQGSPSGSSEYQQGSPNTPGNQQQNEYTQSAGKPGGQQQEEITGPLYLFTT